MTRHALPSSKRPLAGLSSTCDWPWRLREPDGSPTGRASIAPTRAPGVTRDALRWWQALPHRVVVRPVDWAHSPAEYFVAARAPDARPAMTCFRTQGPQNRDRLAHTIGQSDLILSVSVHRAIRGAFPEPGAGMSRARRTSLRAGNRAKRLR